MAARLLDFRCVLVDRPGCGLSPRANRPSTQMRELERVADELVYDVAGALQLERVDVVATSFGGYFALRSAAARPGCVRRLVELGWCFGAPVESTPLSMRVASEPRLGRLLAHIPPTERMVRSLLRQIGLRGAIDSGRFGGVEVAWFRSLLRDTDTMRNEIDATPRLMDLRGFRVDTLLSDATLQRVAGPALFIWGSDDPMGGGATAESFVSRLPDAELEVMPHVGHAPWIDEPDQVAGRVRSFLAER